MQGRVIHHINIKNDKQGAGAIYRAPTLTLNYCRKTERD